MCIQVFLLYLYGVNLPILLIIQYKSKYSEFRNNTFTQSIKDEANNPNEIDNLKRELNLRSTENSNLKSELDKKNSKIEILEKKITELESKGNQINNINIINNNCNELQELYKKLEEKDKKIEFLNNELIGSIKFDDLKFDDKLIIVNFTSRDSKINFPIICKTDTVFEEIEKIFYKKYPDFGKNDGAGNLFLGKGSKIKKSKTMAENGFQGYGITVMKRSF